MAAKPAKKENRGGKRPGAGRPPGREPLSVRQIKEMTQKMKARAKLTGKDENDILIDFIQGEDENGNPVKLSVRDRIACIKLWKDFTSAKISEGPPFFVATQASPQAAASIGARPNGS